MTNSGNKFYKISYHEKVVDDIKKIDKRHWLWMAETIQKRLSTQPELYGKPLRKTLKGYRRLRLGSYRAVYKIEVEANEVKVLIIAIRKVVYDTLYKRLS